VCEHADHGHSSPFPHGSAHPSQPAQKSTSTI
jgi:hypothetical protein